MKTAWPSAYRETSYYGLLTPGDKLVSRFKLYYTTFLRFGQVFLKFFIPEISYRLADTGFPSVPTTQADEGNKRIAVLTVLAGLFAKRPSVMGAGALAASRNTMTSEFASVKKVKAVRWMDTILVKEFLEKNRVYVNKDDFEFVYDYITSRCKKAKIG